MAARSEALLGLIQGPAELLPVSSSGHVEAARLMWGLEGDEVALHAGSLAALVLGCRKEAWTILRRLTWKRVGMHLCAGAIPAAVGYAIERRAPRRPVVPGLLAVDWKEGISVAHWVMRLPRAERLSYRPPAVIEPGSPVRHADRFDPIEIADRTFEPEGRRVDLANRRECLVWTRQRGYFYQPSLGIQQRHSDRAGIAPQIDQAPAPVC